MKVPRKIMSLIFSILVLYSFSQPVQIPWPEVTDSSNLVDTRSQEINYQVKRTFSFSEIGVKVSNEFTGARLNDLILINDSTLSGFIYPENHPVNMSPWYAFRVWSDNTKDIYFKLQYAHGRHRYPPKLSRDGINWIQIDSTDLFSTVDDTTTFFKIHLNYDAIWISAQEILTSDVTYRWIDRLSRKPFITSNIIGYSTLGKPIMAMSITESDGKNLLVILSRQHPPEITGFKEMISFVETIAGNSKMARKFRKRFEVVVVPMMNPDGVDNGHWRHNAGGVDLNRDWRFFNQPETTALRKFILEKMKKQNARVHYGIDFHSTQTDLFYLPDEKDLPDGEGISMKLLNLINKSFPENPFIPEPSGIEEQISKNWFLHELKTEAITYEVGDNTDREIIKKRGKEASLQLMKILLKEYK